MCVCNRRKGEFKKGKRELSMFLLTLSLSLSLSPSPDSEMIQFVAMSPVSILMQHIHSLIENKVCELLKSNDIDLQILSKKVRVCVRVCERVGVGGWKSLF